MTFLSKYFTICCVLWNLGNMWKTKKPVGQRNDDTVWSSFPSTIIVGGYCHFVNGIPALRAVWRAVWIQIGYKLDTPPTINRH